MGESNLVAAVQLGTKQTAANIEKRRLLDS
jgi:hypothetical protein